MEALSFLLGPEKLPKGIGEAPRCLPDHVQRYIDYEFSLLGEWFESWFVRGICPGSRLPYEACPGCQKGGGAADRLEGGNVPNGWDEALRASRFVLGNDRRPAPHAHEIGEAVLAVLRKIRNLYGLAVPQ
jgi:hypothetical protein